MATTRIALGSVLDTVVTTAATVNGALTAASEVIGMANAYVSEAAENQRARMIADREVFIDELIKEKAQERALSNVRVETFCKKSDSHAQHYGEAYDLFTKLLRKSEGEVHQLHAAE